MGALALLLVASCFVGGVFSARMAKLALDDSASVSDASASSADQQQELESVVSALAHMNADSEAMRRVLASGVYPPSPGQPVYSAASDSTPCGGDLVISVPSDRSGSSESVPPRGSQSELPPRLRRTAVGGIRITVKAQAKGAKPTFISSVRFSGRVLYPANPAAYDGM
ncbi:hypothetical protein CHLRE_08g365204v5 [Chlamydomonas reinhardtii]|uniref:Uncharacterized protein n=1 Tax=Chlamydomonas reinhardtii TaxID=3055 RepID=A0A2K3DGT2_CHLRE|nr:uncharacterized protein CHLRE_08g365204v5 [Chlamydomonas reinhardtii]PNW79741.1 hypothetical protein CHLRE_08g365204v5 [Chlamydomonas reinhardtii]